MNDFRRIVRGWDVVAVAASVLATVCVLTPGVPDGLRALVVVPYLLAVPGYAALRVARPGRLRLEDAVLLAIGLSVSVVAIAGLALNVVGPGLTRGAWVIVLDLWLIVALLIAVRRGPTEAGRSVRLPRLRPHAGGAALVAAAVLAALSLALALQGARAQQRRERFAELWLVPSPTHAVVGVRSGEPGVTDYWITLSDGGSRLHTWQGIRLEWGRQWQTVFRLPSQVRAGDDLVARLYRGASGPSVRSVHLTVPG